MSVPWTYAGLALAGLLALQTTAKADDLPAGGEPLRLGATTFVAVSDGFGRRIFLDGQPITYVHKIMRRYALAGGPTEALVWLTWGGGECEAYPVILVGREDGRGTLYEDEFGKSCKGGFRERETRAGILLERDAQPWLDGGRWLLKRDGELVREALFPYPFGADKDWATLEDETAYDLLFIRSTNAALAKTVGDGFSYVDLWLRQGRPGHWLNDRFYVASGDHDRAFVAFDKETGLAYYAHFPGAVGATPRFRPNDAAWPEVLRQARDELFASSK